MKNTIKKKNTDKINKKKEKKFQKIKIPNG